MTAFSFYTLAAGLLGAAVAAYLVFGRKKKTPAEIERERRDWLNQIGRITDGTVIDCLLYTSPSPRDLSTSRMPSSA